MHFKKFTDGKLSHEPEKAAIPVAAPTHVAIKIESPAPDTKEESALDDLFARLSSKNLSMLSSSAKKDSPARPESNTFLFEERLSPPGTPTKMPDSPTASLSGTTVKPAESISEDEPQAAIEQLYLEKAAEYIQALPCDNIATVQVIKTVLKKLQDAIAPSASLSADEAEKVKARYAFAILDYFNKAKAKSITPEFAKQAVRHSEGNMLRIFAKLVEKECLSLADMGGVVGLNQVILDALPKAELEMAPAIPKAESTATASKMETKPVTAKNEDPMNGMKAWPAQEKRETGKSYTLPNRTLIIILTYLAPAYRACILKGVSGVTSINQLQALVWGGRLESIAMPAPGSDFAVVRFLTPEACDKYFKATENGIEIQGEKKTVVFVEKQPGPSSINDVMRNCAEGDASRCVRALDAEEDWSDMVLMKLARGKGAVKREVDRIKQGKTARGVSLPYSAYI
jgi:hypothetical protein